METWKAALQDRAEELRERFGSLQQQKRAIDLEVERIRREIDHLNPVLADNGLGQLALQEQRPGTGGFAAPGNKSENMPARRGIYATVSMADAVAKVLSDGFPKHADEIVKEIWDIRTKQDHFYAKRSLVSTLGDGAKREKWTRVGPNKFQGIAGPEIPDAKGAGAFVRPLELAGSR